MGRKPPFTLCDMRGWGGSYADVVGMVDTADLDSAGITGLGCYAEGPRPCRFESGRPHHNLYNALIQKAIHLIRR